MSGQWPPEWEDPDDGHLDDGLPDQRHSDAGHSELELSEVTSFLASVHSPALPASFEARISAAIAAEAAARSATGPDAAAEPVGPLTAAAGADDAKDRVRSADPEEFPPAATAGGPSAPAARRPRRGARTSRSATRPGTSRPDGRRRLLRMPSLQAASWVLVSCLVLSGFGFLVTRGSGSSASSSYAASGASPVGVGGAGGDVPGKAAGRASQAQPGDASDEPSADAPTGFLVYSTGTTYERSTLASQVRDQLGGHDFGSRGLATPGYSASATAPAAAASSAASTSGAGGSTPSPRLSRGACHGSPAASCPAWWTRPATTESRLTSSRCRLRCGWCDSVARRPTRSSSRQCRSRASRESPRPSIG